MNIRNIRYFVTIAQERSITSAARKLFVSQQSLSGQLKKLEEEAGTPLFYREVPLRLTPAGEVLYQDAGILLQNYDAMLTDLKAVTKEPKQTFTLGISTYSYPPFLSELFSRFHRIRPDVTVNVMRCSHARVGRCIQKMDLYLSYYSLSGDIKSLVTFDIAPFCACLRESLALSAYGDNWDRRRDLLEHTRDLSLLKDLPFILQLDEDGSIACDSKACFETAGFQPKVAFSSEYCECNADLCRNGVGVFLAPKDYLVRYLNPEAVTRKKPEDPLLCFPILLLGFAPQLSLCCARNRHLEEPAATFVSVFREYFSEGDAEATHTA